jgi:hypothetical protein
VLLEKGFPVKEEIVEIQGIQFAFSLPVVSGHRADVVQQIVEVGIALQDDFLDGPLGVDRQAPDIFQNFSPGETGAFGIHLELGDAGLHETLCVFLVEDGVVGLKTHERSVTAEDAVPDVMEGPPPYPAADPHRPRHQQLDPPEHFPRGLVGESDQKNGGGVFPLLDQVGHPVGHHPGFPAPRPGDDQDGSPLGLDHLKLLGIEFLFVVQEERGSWRGKGHWDLYSFSFPRVRMPPCRILRNRSSNPGKVSPNCAAPW